MCSSDLLRHFAGLADAVTDGALAVAHDNQSGKLHDAAALDSLGNAVDGEDVYKRQLIASSFGSAQFVVLGRTGGDESHILLLLRHEIRKVGRKSLSTEKASGCHGHL